MANWYGVARTNYFHANREALRNALSNWSLSINDGEDGTVCLLSNDDDTGGWPSSSMDEDGNEIEFDFASVVMPHVAEGDVVVTMESGAEKMRYVTGNAHAFVRSGEVVSEVGLSLTDIYTKARAAFGSKVKAMTDCSY